MMRMPLPSGLLLVALGAALPAAAQGLTAVTAPTLAIESLPRPTMPPGERFPVLPEQVQRWRQEARAAEHGDGVPRDAVRAAQLYCRAARYGDADSQYDLAWMLANGRGIERDDAQAAHLFAAAAEQGHRQAANMIAKLGTPLGVPPPCLKPMDAAPPPAPSVAGRPPPAVPAPLAVAAPPNAPEAIVRYVTQVAPEYRLQPQLVLAVMATESNFDPLALSPKNAQGLMQLMPDTATRFKVLRIADPAENIRGGMAYLRWLLAYFEGDLTLVLAAYNAGERAVERWRGVPPYAETQAYVRRIVAALNGQRAHPFDAGVTAPSTVFAAARGAGAAR